MILIVVIYKKYRFSYQRLLLYLTINLLIESIVHILQGSSYKLVPSCRRYCQALAFLSTYITFCVKVSLACLILELYLCVLLKKDTSKLKWIYIAAIYLLPSSVSWIPFIFRRFGYAGTRCSVVYLTQDCEHDHIGFLLFILLEWLPIGATFVIIGPMYLLLLYCLWQQGKQYTPLVEVARKTIYQQMLVDISYIKWFPLPLFIINLLLVIAKLIIGHLHVQHSDVTL